MEKTDYDAISFPINRLHKKLLQINIGINLRVRISSKLNQVLDDQLNQVLDDQIGQVVNPTRLNLRLMMRNKF
jgi:hypothetical protein